MQRAVGVLSAPDQGTWEANGSCSECRLETSKVEFSQPVYYKTISRAKESGVVATLLLSFLRRAKITGSPWYLFLVPVLTNMLEIRIFNSYVAI